MEGKINDKGIKPRKLDLLIFKLGILGSQEKKRQ